MGGQLKPLKFRNWCGERALDECTTVVFTNNTPYALLCSLGSSYGHKRSELWSICTYEHSEMVEKMVVVLTNPMVVDVGVMTH